MAHPLAKYMEASNRAFDILDKKMATMTARLEKQYAEKQEQAEAATQKRERMESLLSIPGLDEGQIAAITDRVSRNKEITGGMVGLNDPQTEILRALTIQSKEQSAVTKKLETSKKLETTGRTIDKRIQQVNRGLEGFRMEDPWIGDPRRVVTFESGGVTSTEPIKGTQFETTYNDLMRERFSLEKHRI